MEQCRVPRLIASRPEGSAARVNSETEHLSYAVLTFRDERLANSGFRAAHNLVLPGASKIKLFSSRIISDAFRQEVRFDDAERRTAPQYGRRGCANFSDQVPELGCIVQFGEAGIARRIEANISRNNSRKPIHRLAILPGARPSAGNRVHHRAFVRCRFQLLFQSANLGMQEFPVAVGELFRCRQLTETGWHGEACGKHPASQRGSHLLPLCKARSKISAL